MVAEDKDTINIVINMEKVAVNSKDLSPDGEISFEQVTKLAIEEGGLPTGPYIEYEVFYENGAGRPPEGRLYPSRSTKVQDETPFNVTYTDKS